MFRIGKSRENVDWQLPGPPAEGMSSHCLIGYKVSFCSDGNVSGLDRGDVCTTRRVLSGPYTSPVEGLLGQVYAVPYLELRSNQEIVTESFLYSLLPLRIKNILHSLKSLAFHTNTLQYVNVLASTAHWWWFWVLIVGKSVTIRYWKIRFIVSINKLILTCCISRRMLVTSPVFLCLCVYNTQMMLITLPEFNNIYKRSSSIPRVTICFGPQNKNLILKVFLNSL